MRARIAALVAAVGTAAATAGAAVWARRKAAEDEALEREILQTLEVEAVTEPELATIPVDAGDAVARAVPASDEDDLTALKGIGAISAERLAEAGVTALAQLASWSDEDIDEIGERIKISPERIRREDWVGQARAIVEDRPR